MTSPGSGSSRLLVVAAAGYGKTTALETERPPGGVVRTAVEALAHGLPEARWIGIDDLDGVDVQGQGELLRRLDALPADTGFALTTRAVLDPAARVLLRGQVFQRGPADLALKPFDIARLLADEYAVNDCEASTRVFGLTRGWPALAHFAGDLLARQPDADLARSLTMTSSAAASWVAANVLADVPDAALALLAVIAGTGPVTDRVCDRVAERMDWTQSASSSTAGPSRACWCRATDPATTESQSSCRWSVRCWPEVAARRPSTPGSCARRPRPTRSMTCRSRPSVPSHGQGRIARSSGSSPNAAPRWSAAETPEASPT